MTILRLLLWGLALGLAISVLETFVILVYIQGKGRLDGKYLANVFSAFPFYAASGLVLGFACGFFWLLVSRSSWHRTLEPRHVRAWERGTLVGIFIFLYLIAIIHFSILHLTKIYQPFGIFVTAGLLLFSTVIAFSFETAAIALRHRRRLRTAAALATMFFLTFAFGRVLYMSHNWSFNVFIDKAVSRAKLEGDSSSSRPNILFITIDTLRADHLSAYGYTKIRTENINRLAEEGVLFEQMIAQSSWTKSSFGSIWTSLYPSQHQANSRDVYQSKDRWVLLFSRGLREDVPTMAGLFSDAGYVTVGLNTNGTLRSKNGLNRGFQLYLDMLGQDCMNVFNYSIHWALLNHISPSTINLLKLGTIPYLPAEKLRHLSNLVIARLQAEGKPFFLWVHFMDPHIPYYPREKFAAKLIEYALTGNPAVLFLNALYMDIDRLLSEPDDLPLMKKSMTNLYDGEVIYADRNIGEMLNKLWGSGLLSSTLVVLTSDHGEELFDHGAPGAVENLNLKFYNRGYDHGHTMYDELLRVPLIMRFPNKQYAKQRVESIVQHIDLLPTLLAFAGISAESVGDSFEGINLLPYLRGGEKFPARYAKSEFNNHGPELKQIRSTSYKLIYKMFDKTTEFYHLASDPLEQNNMAGKREEPYERMFSALQSWMGRMPKESPAGEAFPVRIIESPAKHTHKERTKKLMDRLKALGYVQ